MKTLSIRQPWASLICHGIKEVENRTWKTDYRGKVLIHTGVTKVHKNLEMQTPPHMWDEIFLHQMQGTFPEMDELPYGAIIGYATLVDCVEEVTDSVWDGGEGIVKWIFEDAHLFKEPITGVKGKLNLYETEEISEDNLPPARKIEHKVFEVKGDTLLFHTNRELFNLFQSQEYTILEGYLAKSIRPLFLEKKGEGVDVKQYKKFRFLCEGEELELPIKAIDVQHILDEESQEQYHYPLPDGREFYWLVYVIEFDR